MTRREQRSHKICRSFKTLNSAVFKNPLPVIHIQVINEDMVEVTTMGKHMNKLDPYHNITLGAYVLSHGRFVVEELGDLILRKYKRENGFGHLNI